MNSKSPNGEGDPHPSSGPQNSLRGSSQRAVIGLTFSLASICLLAATFFPEKLISVDSMLRDDLGRLAADWTDLLFFVSGAFGLIGLFACGSAKQFIVWPCMAITCWTLYFLVFGLVIFSLD